MATLPAGYIPLHKVPSASSSGSLGFIVCVKCCKMVNSVPRWLLSLSWPIQSDHLSTSQTDDTTFGAGTFSWQDPVHSCWAGPGEVMTVENKQTNRNDSIYKWRWCLGCKWQKNHHMLNSLTQFNRNWLVVKGKRHHIFLDKCIQKRPLWTGRQCTVSARRAVFLHFWWLFLHSLCLQSVRALPRPLERAVH